MQNATGRDARHGIGIHIGIRARLRAATAVVALVASSAYAQQVAPPPGQSGINQQDVPGKADRGNDGFCVYVFGICFGHAPGNGHSGRAGQSITIDNATGFSTIDAPAIRVLSFGQAGGDGGSAIIAGDPGNGGDGGGGGTITLMNAGALTTNGASASGILAQSFGGRGGEGGSAFVIIGGGNAGGRGGSGGAVSIDNGGAIETFGDQASGIRAESVGGRGGDGGDGFGIIASGGSGLYGTSGGSVGITTTGDIVTHGYLAEDILALSVGGGGGNGGDAGGLFTAGGSAGGGVNGGVVSVMASSRLETFGDGARAILAQSIGGGGGNGGNAGGAIALGGQGGVAGSGDAVTVTLTGGSIATAGVDSQAILAQSIGGGGGSGGSAGGLLALGGDAASGGDAGTVGVSSTADIVTGGDRSVAIMAQSVGGGGGSGGDALGIVSLGGGGSGGGGGSSVSVDSSGAIMTTGRESNAVLAQSIGGGGGAGGDSGALLVGLGASGSRGGSGGSVDVTVGGSTGTGGALADAVLAQSIGGGGGRGGDSFGLVALGGSSSVGGNASSVTIGSDAVITTSGEAARGLVAQSIGGGGGVAGGGAGLVALGASGGGGGNGGDVTVSSIGAITTQGLAATAIEAQSIGGGGGAAGGAFGLLAIGGSASAGGDAGAVAVNQTGDLATGGDDADGIAAQSIGGGGGSGGFAGAGGLFASFAIGGSGGRGGNADAVNLALDGGTIGTSGARSSGVFAQSIGGGGGKGGSSFSVSGGLFGDISVAIGGSGGSGGNSGAIGIDNRDAIATSGDEADGVLAQSIGGGGGAGGFAISGAFAAGGVGVSGAIALGASGGSGGAGSTTTITNTGDIATGGRGSSAIVAQSLGGGGGRGGFSIALSGAGGGFALPLGFALGGSGAGGGSADGVAVTSYATLSTLGDDATALLAQSVGGGGGKGGFAISGALGIGETAVPIALSLGGSGGLAGDGGKVDVTATGIVATGGIGANGIEAQSVGGGGGSAGLAASLSAGVGETAVAPSIALGGIGGAGGTGGTVTLASDADVSTIGAQSRAIVAQSVGGGGGDSALTLAGSFAGAEDAYTPAVSLGGASGGGGDGGAVSLRSTGTIVTAGNNAQGLIAQSTGGGGGIAGASIAIADSFSTEKALSGSLAIGGDGGEGGDGGAVDLTAVGSIATTGQTAHAVLAQSIGGGGGIGGLAVAQDFDFSAPGGGQLDSSSFQFSLGGSGGRGGSGGAVDVATQARIATTGAGADGVYAESIGGGGGAGGASGFATDGNATSVTAIVRIGGTGGDGGIGGAVHVDNEGDIATRGDMADGLLVQSIGGGGGSGGKLENNLLASLAASAENVFSNPTTTSDFTATLRIGGAGGSGNDGGAASVVNGGAIAVSGLSADGIFVQSVGGGGGVGGSVVSPVVGAHSETSVDLSIGGFGGSAGDGGAVDVDNKGTVLTIGAASFGVLAQSVGGGGGTGGSITKLFSSYGDETATRLYNYLNGPAPDGKSISSQDSMQIGLSVGGSGGAAGKGGSVSVTNSGTIVGQGLDSYGVGAVSIGGGGGNGGGVAVEDTADVVNGVIGSPTKKLDDLIKQLDEDQKTFNDDAAKAVSKFNDLFGTDYSADNPLDLSIVKDKLVSLKSLAATLETKPYFANVTNMALTLGGSGGASGDGGAVSVTNSGAVHMIAEGSTGIFAQSIGGGGGTLSSLYKRVPGVTEAQIGGGGGDTGGLGGGTGNGGDDKKDAYTKIGSFEGAMSTNETLAIGGFGGAAGDGGRIDISNSGSIVVDGADSYGIFAQSIGGGGGKAGSSGSDAVKSASLLDDTIKVNGIDQYLLGGAAGDGGAIHIDNSGTIVVNGDNSYGIYAQSIGGGGGTSLSFVPTKAFAAFDDARKDLLKQVDTVTSQYLGFDLSGIEKYVGGAAKAQDELRKIVKKIDSAAETIGASSVLTFGHADLDPAIDKLTAITTALKSIDDVLKGGETALKTFEKDIQTQIDSLTTPLIPPLYTGNGGDVVVTSTGSVVLNGKNDIAYVAQSVGGKGGLVRMPDGALVLGSAGGTGNAGTLSVEQHGDLVATGENGIGFLGQSASSAGQGDMAITLDGNVVGGSGTGVGVRIDGGHANRINLSGLVTAIDGEAILGGDGDDAFVSTGRIDGNIRLGLGANSLLSQGAASSVVGRSIIDLNGGTFTNEGLLTLGGVTLEQQIAATRTVARVQSSRIPQAAALADADAAQTTLLIGDYVQTDTGRFQADLSFGPYASDQLQVTGSATVAGTIDVTSLAIEDDRPVTLIDARGGVTLGAVTVPGTLAIDYGAVVAGTALQVTLTPHFERPVYRPNAQALGRFLDHTLDVGGATALGPMLLYLGQLQDLATYRKAIDALSPESYLIPLQTTQFAAEDAAAAAAAGCRSGGDGLSVTSGAGCGWVTMRLGHSRRKTTTNDVGYENNVDGVATGIERHIGGDWSAGLSVGWQSEQPQSLDDNSARFSTHLYWGGIGLRWAPDHGELAFSLAGGGGTYSSSRRIDIAGPALSPQTATARLPTMFLDGHIHAARALPIGRAYLKPRADVDFAYVNIDAFGETGAGDIASRSPGGDHLGIAIKPALEAGLTLGDANGFRLKLWVSVGGTWRARRDYSLPFAFTGSLGAAGTYRQSIRYDGWLTALDAGLDLFDTGKLRLEFRYSGEFDKGYNRQFGHMDVTVRF